MVAALRLDQRCRLSGVQRGSIASKGHANPLSGAFDIWRAMPHIAQVDQGWLRAGRGGGFPRALRPRGIGQRVGRFVPKQLRLDPLNNKALRSLYGLTRGRLRL